jgi:nicotinamide/nicotinate riboside kinase
VPIDQETQLANWDCPESVDFEKFSRLIEYTKAHNGQLPPDFSSNEESNIHDGSKLISSEASAQIEQILKPFSTNQDAIFVFVDGFMLYWDDKVSQHIDCKIAFTGSYETLKSRREKRQGYHTLEGYWVDPPGYFDKIVWPEFLRLSKHNATINDILTINTDVYSIDETALLVANKLTELL